VAALGFFLFAVRAVLQAWLLDATPPGLGGSAIGILFGAQAAGAAIGPICAGILADHFGIMAAFYFLAGTILVANLLIFITPSRARLGQIESPQAPLPAEAEQTLAGMVSGTPSSPETAGPASNARS
jgi:MFS family permease